MAEHPHLPYGHLRTPGPRVSVLGVVLIVLGSLAAMALIALRVLGVVGASIAEPQRPVDGTTVVVTADDAGETYTIFLRTARSEVGIDPGWPIDCTVTGPLGEEVALQDVGPAAVRRTTQSSSFFPRHRWRAAQPGHHQVDCADDRFGVGQRSSAGGLVTGLGPGLAAAAAIVVLGTVVTSVHAVRRARREWAAAAPHDLRGPPRWPPA